MLFRKKIEKSCSYCAHGTKLEDSNILCSKRGVRDADSRCRKFEYDPLQRIPCRMKPLDFDQYQKEDFTL